MFASVNLYSTKTGEIKSFLDKLLSAINIVSMDFVEFNPLLDKDNQTLNLCLEILEFLFRRINK